MLLFSLSVFLSLCLVSQGQQISVQGQQVAQTADGQTIVYQPVNADGTVLQQGKLNFLLDSSVCLLPCELCRVVLLNKDCDDNLFAGMITIPAASLAGAQIVQAGGANTNTTNSGQGTVTVTLPVSGNMVNAGGMVMVRPCAEVPNVLLPFFYLDSVYSVVEGHKVLSIIVYIFFAYHISKPIKVWRSNACVLFW